jgi:FAD/FMN-containing dehydrogenase
VGRGLLLAGNHAQHGSSRVKHVRQRLGVPFQPPINVLTPLFLKAFNATYFHANRHRVNPHPVSFQPFFFPLDGVANWNRLYGPKGLYQHQSVVPEEVVREVLPALLGAARDSGQASFLTVLKRFGDVASPGLLSFPRPGFTLTLDFPNRGERTLRLLERLDDITIDAGGRVNPYKDARMSAAVFSSSFPGWRNLEASRDPAFMSDFWRRTAMQLKLSDPNLRQAAE